MLKILLEKQITNVLVVVTRYFGGTLLGTGGLVRAYTGATLKALENVNIIKKKMGYKIEIQIEYSEFEKAKNFFETINAKIVNSEFLNNIVLNVEIDKKGLKYVEAGNDKIGFQIIKFDILEEKFI